MQVFVYLSEASVRVEQYEYNSGFFPLVFSQTTNLVYLEIEKLVKKDTGGRLQ